MMQLKKYSATFGSALIVTYALMLLMSILIDQGEDVIVTVPDTKGLFEFIRIPKPTEPVITKTPVKPVSAQKPPPFVHVRETENKSNNGENTFVPPLITPVVETINGQMGGSHMMPTFFVAPLYPEKAVTRGIEGFVVLEFTVTQTGSVIDPVVLEAEPEGYFESAAIKAMKRIKYKPQLDIDGKAIATHSVRYQFTFQLDK